MAKESPFPTNASGTTQPATETPDPQPVRTQASGTVERRSFLKGMGAVGAALSVGSLLSGEAEAASSKPITKGDIAILQFLAAAEILETDLWLQYAELGGFQDSELPGMPTGGSPLYTLAIQQLDGDMDRYISDNTEDELTHEQFINAYLISKGANPVNLDAFRTLPSSKATGANQIGRLTNLMQLTVDTTWWTRYRSRTKNPDRHDSFAQAIATLAVGQHTAIPRTDADVAPDPNKPNGISDFTQAIANTAGFHFVSIEQGGTSIYPQLAQRVTSQEVLRILLSIGGTEITHFQTWHDKAGNAIHLANVIDPVTGVSVTFPDLNAAPFGGEDFQTNLIMPEPTVFLSQKFPPCSIIRPTATHGAAMGAVQGLSASGLFIGQSPEFFAAVTALATAADAATRAF